VPNWLHVRQMGARHGPLPVGFKWQSKHVIGNAQIPVSPARHRFRNDRLHFLRNDSDICRMAAVVDEAIVAEAVAEPSEQNNIVLEPEVGAPPATTASAMAAASMPAAESTASAAVESATAHPPASEASRPSAAKTAGSSAAVKSAGATAAVESGVAPARETARSTTMAGAWPVGWAIRGPRAAWTTGPASARTIASPRTATGSADTAWFARSANAPRLPQPSGTSRSADAAWFAGSANAAKLP
jgi:hypothetical protein